MKRLFWLGLGAAVGVYATRRTQRAAHSLTPAGVGANLADGLRELGAGLGSFGAEVRAGMTAREQELTDLVERRTGAVLPTVARSFAAQTVSAQTVSAQSFAEPAPARRPSPTPRARAPRAGA